MKKIAVLFVLSVLATSLYAHGGRTDKNGCHNESKTGTRHCH